MVAIVWKRIVTRPFSTSSTTPFVMIVMIGSGYVTQCVSSNFKGSKAVSSIIIIIGINIPFTLCHYLSQVSKEGILRLTTQEWFVRTDFEIVSKLLEPILVHIFPHTWVILVRTQTQRIRLQAKTRREKRRILIYLIYNVITTHSLHKLFLAWPTFNSITLTVYIGTYAKWLTYKKAHKNTHKRENFIDRKY